MKVVKRILMWFEDEKCYIVVQKRTMYRVGGSGGRICMMQSVKREKKDISNGTKC
jgi:hypothetical protein